MSGSSIERRRYLTFLAEAIAEIETMNLTDDERTKNNVMRHQYRVLTDAEKDQMTIIKDMGLGFAQFCNTLGTSRELSLAITKMEEAVMWAVKHTTK